MFGQIRQGDGLASIYVWSDRLFQTINDQHVVHTNIWRIIFTALRQILRLFLAVQLASLKQVEVLQSTTLSLSKSFALKDQVGRGE
jgi:hypothetical protein